MLLFLRMRQTVVFYQVYFFFATRIALAVIATGSITRVLPISNEQWITVSSALKACCMLQ